jgi:2-phosphosulfolactate phosphatase
VSIFDQREFACRCEWGPQSSAALAPADVIIVVDVLSFTTCVDIAVSRGVLIWPARPGESVPAPPGAVVAGRRGQAEYSLSPASFLTAPDGLHCVLPSPNGAALARAAAQTGAMVLAACLRNAEAVARDAASIGTTFNVCPAGERWRDGSIRFAIEDWIGAGAVLRGLPGRRSPEAAAAVAAFEQSRNNLQRALSDSASGRELIALGYANDVKLSSEVDVSGTVPRLVGEVFAAAQP